MGQVKRFAPFVVLVVVFVLLQPLLILVDGRQTPESTAKAFVKDYYGLKPAMADRLCAPMFENGQPVDDFLYAKYTEARQRGFEIDYLRRMFTHMDVATLERDDRNARVHITGTTRTAINPVYMVIGRWFGLGRNHPVDITLDLVKEDNQWRVCGGVPGM